jgi:3D-(3,5/4)-trihydroxycyclohexane-1,2-dione acylhydrolase (decyclizing)
VVGTGACRGPRPGHPVRPGGLPAESDVVIPDTDAVLTQGQLIGLLQEHAQAGDTIIAAAGGPPGDLQKVWDATGGRGCHLEFGFSCMGYEIPAAIGDPARRPRPGRSGSPPHRRRHLPDGADRTGHRRPGKLAVTVVIPENHGYQVIHRLQMLRSGREFGNEFRYRPGGLTTRGRATPSRPPDRRLPQGRPRPGRAGLGARASAPPPPTRCRTALAETRGHPGPVVIVVPVIPHADLPGAACWWDVAPAEVSEQDPSVAPSCAEYETGLATQRWYG